MLYLISTPIGHLDDITLRVLKTIESLDYLLCEDTRHTQRLLQHFNLRKPLYSYHKFNEAKKNKEILEDLKAGKLIGLISDAGTPTLFDPGMRLVDLCHNEKIPLTALPGPSSPIVALSLSGFDTMRFQCVGFLPKKQKAHETILIDALNYPGTTLALESPYRLIKTLTLLAKLDSERPLFIARELTKKFEELLRGPAPVLLKRWENSSPKGEIVLAIQGVS